MDLGQTTIKFQNWWNRHAEMYHWDFTENGHWEIDFETCEIFLVEN